MNQKRSEKYYLDLAARVASRAFGHAEPNPMVGAVLVKDNRVIGIGHHRRFGDLHAERDAIAAARASGHDPHGATLYCTLEPCCHHGKQPPCTDAVIEAGIKRVVIASRDPHSVSSGGWALLEAAGVTVTQSDSSQNAHFVSQPFLHRIETGTPWVIAKWAQTIDGRIATRTGQSQWISSARCRARVHRLRARVDAVMIGVGTAIADDPMLTARDCPSVRRIAKRVVLDTGGRLPLGSRLVETAARIPTIVYTQRPGAFAGTSIIAEPATVRDGRIDIRACLGHLHRVHAVATVLSESGPTLLGSLLEHKLINQAVVHLAPGILGDAQAMPVATGRDAPSLEQMRRFTLLRSKPIGSDVELHYAAQAEASPGLVQNDSDS
jgi:diaminohydroxyphosphoribosylaminopyrimidine deaminase/5-amino-6-(5-phosphoribosylamino)uracil reductase